MVIKCPSCKSLYQDRTTKKCPACGQVPDEPKIMGRIEGFGIIGRHIRSKIYEALFDMGLTIGATDRDRIKKLLREYEVALIDWANSPTKKDTPKAK